MAPAALIAVVAGVFVLQQQAALPGVLALSALAGLSLVAGAVAWRMGREPRARRANSVVFGMVAAALAGFAWAAWMAQARLADELAFADEGRDVRLTGVIASLPAQLERGVRFEFEVESVETPGVHVPARIALAWYGGLSEVVPAERWRFVVRLKRPHGTFNPGGFDVEAWMLERDLRASGYVRSLPGDDAARRIAPMVWRPGFAIDRARFELRAKLQQRLAGTRYGGVLIALVLGDQRAIAEQDWVLFNRTGISHLVSISGLHITMIAGLAALVVGALWRRSSRLLAIAPAQSAAALAAVCAALVYCLLAGWGVPAQRTFFMLATVAAALVLRVGARPATTLALAAAVVCAIDPWAVTAAGFWLSFGAVAAIFFVVQGRFAATTGWPARVREAVRVQAAVTLALIPMTIVLFQQVSIVSPLANAIAIPLVSLVVTPLALIGGFFVVWPEPFSALAVPCLAFAHWLFEQLALALQWAVQFRWASIAVAAPPSWAVVLALAGVAWLLAPPGWPARWAAATWFIPLFVWPAARPAAGEIWVTAIDVGQGMAVLVETRAQTLLYDTGPRYSAETDAGARVIAPYLRWRGIGQLDLLVVSHLDSDHSGGTASLLRSLPIERVWTSVRADHPMFALARAEPCVAGQVLKLGELQLRVLHPTRADFERGDLSINAMSCVLEVRHGPSRVLLTGDLPARQEQQLVERAAGLESTLVSAPHHGSRGSSSEAFVNATRPRWVVFQSGYRNRFGHPDAEVVARYAAAGAALVRTDHAGATQWRFGAGGETVVESMRLERARYWHNRPGREAQLPGEVANDALPSLQAEPQVEPLPSF